MIVDEEQRFGVAQKELLRSLRLEVDVLALTATPIPRTLHMSLSGLRDISIIETPPEGRRPIRTYVGEYDEELIRTRARARARARRPVVLPPQPRRDDRRGGGEAAGAVPGAALPRRARADARSASSSSGCYAFLRGDADVLVSTTIIESGLDIPQANTLIVERADMLGLAQLYQIRGRVGRSDVPAHAYLFYPDSRGADAGGARPARDARRPHRARRRLRDRDARPRDPRRRRAARRRAVRPRRGASASSSTSSCSDEAVAELRGPAPAGRAPGPRRRPHRRVRARRLRRVRGAEDRPAPPARARRRPRTSCASSTPRSRTATARCPSRSRTSSRSRRRS